MNKGSACNMGYSGGVGSILGLGRSPGGGLGRSPGGGHGNHSNDLLPMDRGARQAMVHRVTKNQT